MSLYLGSELLSGTVQNNIRSTTVVDATSGDKTITFTQSNSNSEYRYVYASGIASLTLKSDGTFSTATEAYYSIVFISGSVAAAVANGIGAYFTGDECVSGVFSPVSGKTYEVGIWWNGISWQGIVRGV